MQRLARRRYRVCGVERGYAVNFTGNNYERGAVVFVEYLAKFIFGRKQSKLIWQFDVRGAAFIR